MPEGPFGFPRFTTLGPLTRESIDEDLTAADLSLRSHSIRNYRPEEFRVAVENSGKPEAREALRSIEANRFEPVLKDFHRFFVHLDQDERETWARNNPLLIRWVNVWGFLEDQIQWREFE